MSQVSGIQFEKDKNGLKRFVRIDLKEHGKEIEPFLQKLNIKNDWQFEEEWQNSLTPEQFKKDMHSRIRKWNKK
ncbi:MAG: hypothetical protein K9H26_11475 [Prolixibacteraceae bacterium]|jgi:hypothetical protein|nr:hypothetical protein [Prolixibacteraceae bacterium]